MFDIVLFLLQLGWREIVFVSDDIQGVESVCDLNDLSHHVVQHMLVSGGEVLSGEWVKRMVKTGEDSWRPLNIVLMCSLPCIQSALQKASKLELKYGTQSAFPMSSHWLLIPTGGDNLLDYLLVHNVTMDNVALVSRKRTVPGAVRCRCLLDGASVQTLLWAPGGGREWRPVCGDGTHPHPPHTTSTNTTLPYESRLDRLLFPNVQHGYNGRHLKVIAKEWLNEAVEVRENGTLVWKGLVVDLIQVASLTLNFTYDIVEPAVDFWGSGTFNNPDVGYFSHVIKKEVDLGLVLTDIILDRQVVMDFTDTVTYSSYVMVYRPPETTDELKTVLGPLSQWLLLAIGGALVAVTMALVVFELCACSDQGAVHGDIGCVGDVTVSQTLLTLDKVLHITRAALLSESSEVQMRSRSGKVLLMSWWMFSLVMAAAYSSTLTAFLSVTKDRQLFSRLEDLVSKQHGYTWGVLDGSSSLISLSTSTLPLYKQLWAAIQRFAATDPDVISVNVTTIASKVRQGDFVAILPQPYAVGMFGDDCEVVMVDAGMKQILFGMTLPRGSALTKPLSQVIRGLHSAGILSHWTAIWFPRVVCPSPPDSKVISLQHVQGVMMVVPVGVGLALLVLLVEILYVGRRAGRNQQMTGQ